MVVPANLKLNMKLLLELQSATRKSIPVIFLPDR
jgi:hypothetical protein